MKENSRHFVRGIFGCVFLLMSTGTAVAAHPQNVPPDNTKTNQRDRNEGSVTANQQGVNSSDTETTKTIRKSLMQDKNLSTYAHNVKIISRNGKVRLKGPVRSDEEKETVASKAAAVVGESNVTNEITVAPPKK